VFFAIAANHQCQERLRRSAALQIVLHCARTVHTLCGTSSVEVVLLPATKADAHHDNQVRTTAPSLTLRWQKTTVVNDNCPSGTLPREYRLLQPQASASGGGGFAAQQYTKASRVQSGNSRLRRNLCGGCAHVSKRYAGMFPRDKIMEGHAPSWPCAQCWRTRPPRVTPKHYLVAAAGSVRNGVRNAVAPSQVAIPQLYGVAAAGRVSRYAGRWR